MPTSGSAQPYKTHQLTQAGQPKTEQTETDYKLEVNIKFDQLSIFYQALTKLVTTFKSKNTFCYEVEID